MTVYDLYIIFCKMIAFCTFIIHYHYFILILSYLKIDCNVNYVIPLMFLACGIVEVPAGIY
jgi:hypothetical protein